MSDWFERFGYAEVSEGLLVGAYPLDASDVARLAREGVTCVFNLVADAEYADEVRPALAAALQQAGIAERRVELVDYGRLAPEQLEQATAAVCEWLDAGERVYLHCRAGWQRSAAVAAGVVALRDGCAIDEALARVRRRKPSAEPLAHQLEDLHAWWRARSVRNDA